MLHDDRKQTGHDSTDLAPSKGETLAEITKRLRAKLKDHTLEVAVEVVSMGRRWDSRFADQAGGKSFTAWLSTFSPGRGIAYYAERAEQYTRLKHHCRDVLKKAEARGLFWLRQVPDEDLPTASAEISALFHERGGVPVTANQVSRLLSRYSTSKVSGGGALREENAKLRERIRRLEAQVRSLGGEPVL
jgi:hypothetical protein